MTIAPVRPAPRLPDGFVVRLSRRTRTAPADDGGLLLLGGTAGRVLRVAPAAVRLVRDRALVVDGPTSARLARALLDAGVADPVPAPAPSVRSTVTVVVPAYDDGAGVAALLAVLPPEVPVVVVDDASDRVGADALRRAVGARPGTVLLRHDVNRGPAAARNTGLLAVGTPVVCFCDADVLPPADPAWLDRLLGHLADPLVGLVAPRVVAAPGPPGARPGAVAAYERARSSLDLGDLPAAVRPGAAVSYLPSACLLARTDAVREGFDDRMRVAEDVDLVWRSVAAGWRVRYDPAARVGHRHRADPVAWLRRKAFYGTGAALLARRHGDAVAPVVLAPWTAALVVAVLAQRRWSAPVAVAVTAAATVRVAARLPRAAHPRRVAARLVADGVVATASQGAAVATRHHWPLAVAACLVSRRARRAVALAAVVDGLLDHRRTGADLDPVRYLALRRLDDLAYGAGVWGGALRTRSVRALLPRGTGRPQQGPRGPAEDVRGGSAGSRR